MAGRAAKAAITITGDPAADQLLVDDPMALLIGMLLDQQISMELAFTGPFRLRERLGGSLDPRLIADMDPETFTDLCRQKPALHRFPASMAGRIQDLARHIVDRYDGDAGRVWKRVRSAERQWSNIRGLPGYGDEKAKILMAILAKRLGRTPAGWEALAAPFDDDEPRSVADVGSADDLVRVRAWKKAQKAARKDKQGRAL